MLSSSLTFSLYTRNIDASLTRISREPAVARDSEYFAKTIGTIKSADEFISNYRLFSYAMKAFGLEDMTYAKGFMKKILSQSVYNDNSVVNRLTDTRFREFAKAFNFFDFGATATKTPSLVADVTNRFLQIALEKQAGDQNDGARLALYFQRVAPTVSSITGLFADKALYQVIQTIYNLPSASSAQIDALINVVSKNISVDSLKDPATLNKLLTRFTATWDAKNPTTTINTALALLSTTTPTSQALLFDLQKLYR